MQDSEEKGSISALKINLTKDQDSGKNLILDDKMIRENQLKSRKQLYSPIHEEVLVGDTVSIKNKVDKHKKNDYYYYILLKYLSRWSKVRI